MASKFHLKTATATASSTSTCMPATARSSSAANSTRPSSRPWTASSRCARTRSEGAFELKDASNGKSYFVLKATNGQVVGQSQMYASEASCKNGIESVKKNAPDAVPAERHLSV